MNKNKFLIFVAAFAATVSASAQQVTTSAASGSSNGLLGQRYVEVGLYTVDFRDIPVGNAHGGDIGVNMPLAANFDASFSYEYGRLSDSINNIKFKFTGHEIAGRLTAHTQLGSVRPFADATVGYYWAKGSAVGLRFNEDEGFYALGVGVEIPLATSTALTGRVDYGDSFDSNGGSGTWTYGASLDHWFTSKFGAGVGIAFGEDDFTIYRLAARFRF